MTAWDIAVIGAGVAGCTAATLLAQHGLRVILLEKGVLPRQKVCGEFLSPDGAEVLRRLGAWPQLEAHHPPRVEGFTLTAGRRQTRHRLPCSGWGVSRGILDHLLWQHAQRSGVVTHERCTVARVSGDFQRGFSLTLQPTGLAPTAIQARAVVCAAGRHWQRRGQSTSPSQRSTRRFVGLKAHFQGVPLDRHVELHTIRQGYCGMVEVTGGVTNLCCWVEAEALRRAGPLPQRFLVATLAENAHLRTRLQTAQQVGTSWATTSFTYRTSVTPVTADVWNIGDCAAMVAPLTGDGMGMGLRMAELAATIMLDVFRKESSWNQLSAEYARHWKREFLARLRWGRGLEALLLRPRLAWLSSTALCYFPGLMEQLYRRTRQLSPLPSSSRGASHKDRW